MVQTEWDEQSVEECINTSSNSIQAYDCFSKCNQCSEDNRLNRFVIYF